MRRRAQLPVRYFAFHRLSCSEFNAGSGTCNRLHKRVLTEMGMPDPMGLAVKRSFLLLVHQEDATRSPRRHAPGSTAEW